MIMIRILTDKYVANGIYVEFIRINNIIVINHLII